MDVQIYIDCSLDSELDFAAIVEPITSDLREWLGDKSALSILAYCPEDEVEDWILGLSMKLKNKFKLKDPLNFLYEIAKKYKCEFVVAEYNAENDIREAVCYFGFEEGRPDMYEIANYLGL